MKKFTAIFSMCVLSGFLLIGCERKQGVLAGNDGDIYKPRPAPRTDEMQGELLRVNAPNRTVEVRLENGLGQTFRYDGNTVVSGLENEPKPPAAIVAKAGALASLVGKEGSEVTVHFSEGDDEKLARTIDVTEIHITKPARRSGRR
jgi:hypothetical protein